jgi:A/G-specific adenine glycosylase
MVPALLAWYRANARDLPWRNTGDPYAIWISEIMLQQTQVKTVIPYWQTWMTRFPDVRAAANASLENILKCWEGLGYYSRARNFQKAARVVVAKYRGRMPKTLDEILELPGIGRYTAGAICSIAYDQPAPLLDGNVIRVLTRVFGISSDPAKPATNERLWKLAEHLVQTADQNRVIGHRPCSDLNQGLMELGALICAPSNPDCARCPLQPHCVAFRRQSIHRIPWKRSKGPATARRFIAVVFQDDNRVLVRRRPAGVVNGGLWEFPNVEVHPKQPDKAALAELGHQSAEKLSALCQIKHTITRYRITLDVFVAQPNSPSALPSGNWRTLSGLRRLPFSSAHKKIVQRLSASSGDN